MANFTAIKSANEQGLQHNGRSSDLDSQTSPPALNCAKDSVSFAAGAKSGSGMVTVVSWNAGGTKHGMFDALLFERVIVRPRTKNLGFVLSSMVFDVEVWNTFQASAKTLNSITISGSAGLAITGGSTVPGEFGPGQAFTFTATVSQNGAPGIQNVVTFNFAGGIQGTELTLSGSRVMAFPHRPDWTEPFRKTPAWMTEILAGYDTTEQRRALRLRPRHTIAYRVMTVDPLETASLEALLYGWQTRQFGVPVWPESTPLLAPLAPGAIVLYADTTESPSFEPGGLVMVWSDFSTWEAFQVVNVTPGSIEIGSQVAQPWAAGARVVPMRRGHLQADQALGRPANWLSSGMFVFDCEAV